MGTGRRNGHGTILNARMILKNGSRLHNTLNPFIHRGEGNVTDSGDAEKFSEVGTGQLPSAILQEYAQIVLRGGEVGLTSDGPSQGVFRFVQLVSLEKDVG